MRRTDWRLTSTRSSERQANHTLVYITIVRSGFAAICNQVQQFIFSWRSMHLYLVTCRVSVQTLAFSFVVRCLGGYAYAFGHILDPLATFLTRLQAQSASDHEPPLVLNRHCDICEFKQLCGAKAAEVDNLTLLRGMTSKQMAHHNSKGIFSVRQLSLHVPPETTSEAAKATVPS